MPEPFGRLRIALLTHSVNPRGGVVHTLELAQALHAAGHEVTVIAPAMPGQHFFRPLRCAAHLVPVAETPRDMVRMVGSRIEALRTSIAELLGRRSFDVLHAHDPIGANALADLQMNGAIGGFVRTVHHLEHFDAPQLMHWQERGFRAARQVFCVSRLWVGRLAAEHGVQAEEVSNGIDTQRFSPVSQAGDVQLAARLGLAADGGPVVLAIGGVEERKNTHRLLEAFALLREHRPAARLVIAGGASLLDHARYGRAFAERAQQLGLAIGAGQPIVLTGALADAEMPGLYRLADVVAMPSLNEGFGLVVLEALASGVPVMVSRIAPFTEYLQDGDAHWADPMDAAAIADALQEALTAASPARIAASSARLAARFDWLGSAERHLGLYRAGLAAQARATRAERAARVAREQAAPALHR